MMSVAPDDLMVAKPMPVDGALDEAIGPSQGAVSSRYWVRSPRVAAFDGSGVGLGAEHTMGMANGIADVDALASPFGRYMRTRLARLGFTVGPALLVATTAWPVAAPIAGLRTTGLEVGALVWACVVFVGIQLSIWLVPMTVINERGIRRTLNRPRRIAWDEVEDFSIEAYGPSAWVFAHLHDERRVRLYGVPAAAVPGLSRLIGSVPPPTA